MAALPPALLSSRLGQRRHDAAQAVPFQSV